jgi:hypothetical protein
MKRPTTTNAVGNEGAAKITEAPNPAAPLEAATRWPKADKRQESPAPPPVWTRYIDSRLKQFCTR